MEKPLGASLVSVFVAAFSGLAIAQSDDCASATPIAGSGTFAYSNVGATSGGSRPSCNAPLGMSADVWFSWTSGPGTSYRFSSCGGSLDVVLALWDACGGTELGCEDLVGCTSAATDVNLDVAGLTPNTTYLLQIDGWNGATGSGAIDIAPFQVLPNDDCGGATPIAGAGSFPFSTLGATDSGAAASCNNPVGGVSRDVWFAWTTGSASDYTIEVCNGTFDVILSLYDGCSGLELACEDTQGCTSSVNDVTLDLTGLSPNTTHLIQVDGWNGAIGSGALQITSFATPPPNDACGSATPIAGVGSFPFDTGAATSSGTPAACNSGGSADVWFRWTSGVAAAYRFAVCGGSLDPVIALWSGCGGTELACADANGCTPSSSDASFTVMGLAPNTQYWVQIDGEGGATGVGALDISTLVPPTPIGTNYCFGLPNSSGGLATISAFGSSSVAAQSLALEAAGLPPNVSGIFYYGTSELLTPFGDGFKCVGGQIQRLPFDQAGPNGVMSEPNVFSHPMPNVPLAPGSLRFQAWFRDPAAQGAGFNLSNGLLIGFAP